MLRTVISWITTVVIALAYAVGAYVDIAQPTDAVKGAEHLGYPAYFFTILGVWKAGAVIAILLLGLPRLKEWTYAGLFFNLTGAAATHLFVKDPIPDVITPLVILCIVIVSYALRPACRRLPGPVI